MKWARLKSEAAMSQVRRKSIRWWQERPRARSERRRSEMRERSDDLVEKGKINDKTKR